MRTLDGALTALGVIALLVAGAVGPAAGGGEGVTDRASPASGVDGPPGHAADDSPNRSTEEQSGGADGRYLATGTRGRALAGGAGGGYLASNAADPRLANGTVARSRAARVGAAGQASRTINLTQEFALTPETPGRVEVRLRYDVPEPVVSMETTVPADAAVVDVTGFAASGNRTYAWDGFTERPTITYGLPVNESITDDSPQGANGTYVSVDAGAWALFQRPATTTRYEHTEPVRFERTQRTDGPGASGKWLVYLGEHRTYRRSAHGQAFRVVVPAAANTTAAPTAVLDSMVAASGDLRVGDRDPAVFAVAAPTDGVDWAARGATVGDADIWVRDDEPLASADNAWLHEYVHTRQAFATTPEMRWFEEGSAAYYAALLTLDQRRINYSQFRDRLAAGERATYDDVVLANRSTWEGYPQYDKGALVAGEVDRRLRLAPDNRTLMPVVWAMNQRHSPVTVAHYRGFVDSMAGDEVAAVSDEAVTTPYNASAWNRSAHVAAFGPLPPRVTARLPAPNRTASLSVTGPYRSRTYNGSGPGTLVTGERLAVNAVVTNHGNRSAAFNATLRRNGSVVAFRQGTLAANETRTVALGHTFRTPGTYELGVGDDALVVGVRDPPAPSLEAVRVDDRRVRQGGDVIVTAIAGNDGAVPAAGPVRITRDGEPVAIQHVTVQPNGTAVVQTAVPMPDAGTSIVRINDDRAVRITVSPAPNAGTNGSASGEGDAAGSGTADGPASGTADAAATADRRASGTATAGDGARFSRRGPAGGWIAPVTGAVAVLVAFGLFHRRNGA